jgi:hypothetical protein
LLRRAMDILFEATETDELPLECQPWPDKVFVSRSEFLDICPITAHRRTVSGFTIRCGQPTFRGGGGKCYTLDHEFVRVSYSPWRPGTKELYVCDRRVSKWNKDGRFRDSRQFVWAYVCILLEHPEWINAREVFRVYARTLFWPAYVVCPILYEEKADSHDAH